ncbi:PQQ-binding-like beta-propeller repeat protein [Actinoplanes sp. NPDC049599]|uniref:outer membrane protein assembly factor BamB family protein n=1 Tax=Actinoplanes sp. NPDC049599 TaxID=3363903 RepID=UPI0037A648D8
MHRIAVTALACLTLLAGAAPAGAAPVTGPDAAGAARLRMAWSVGPAAAGIVTAPVYLAGATYHLEGVADPAKVRSLVRVVRRDAGTGRRLPFATGAIDSIMGYRPAADGRSLYVATYREQTHVWAFRPDGRVLWSRAQPGEQFPQSPMPAGRRLITVSRSGCDVECAHTTVFGWNAADGTPAWSYSLPGGYVKSVATAGHAAVLINTGGTSTLTVLDAVTGGLLWSRTVAGGSGIALDATHAYVADGSLRAYAVRDGSPAWAGENAGYTAAYPSPYGIFATSGARYAAYDPTGRRRWSSGIHPRGTLTVDNGVVYFQQSPTRQGAGPAYLVATRASTGVVLSRVRIWSRISIGDVTVGGGRVFTKALLEKIVAFAPARR